MRNLFVALLALPNLAAALSSTSKLFMPGGPVNQNQRLVSKIGSDATATTWAVTCTPNPTATAKCDIASPYLVYTIGANMMQMSFTQGPPYDVSCTLTSTVGGFCSGHVTGNAFSTALDQNYMTSFGYRQVTVTDSFASRTSSSVVSTTSSSSSTSKSPSSSSAKSTIKSSSTGTIPSTSLVAPTSIPTGVLNSRSSSASTGTSTKPAANGGLGGGATESKSTNLGSPPMVTGAMKMMAAAAVVGGAVQL